MSASSKFNAMLAHRTPAAVADIILRKYKTVPDGMYARLDPAIRDKIPDHRLPQALLGTRKERLKKEQGKVRDRIQELMDLIPDYWWQIPNPYTQRQHWSIQLDKDPQWHLDQLLARGRAWWDKHRKDGTAVGDVLTLHRKQFGWPNRLPSKKFLVEKLTNPLYLGLDRKLASQAVEAFLDPIKKQRKADRQALALAREEARKKRQPIIEENRRRKAEEEQRLLSCGQGLDDSRISWRRPSEIAELVGLSPSTIRSDINKGRLGYTQRIGAIWGTTTTLHSRQDLRNWISTWRNDIDVKKVELPTRMEIKALEKLVDKKKQQEPGATPERMFDGYKLTPSSGWPKGIDIVLDENEDKARVRLLGYKGDSTGLDWELDELAKSWRAALAKRIEVHKWNTKTVKALGKYFNRPGLGQLKTVWPYIASRQLLQQRVEALMSHHLARFIAQNPRYLGNSPDLEGVSLDQPLSWYPKTRKLQRNWILHIGPTNSGKTHQAMEDLAKAKTGIYLAPLRLMALEGFDRLVGKGNRVALITGEERRVSENCGDHHPSHISATIEAGFTESQYHDIAVIDEAQMIFDANRGWAWSQALLGIQAKTIHVCAAPEAEEALLDLAKSCGDRVEVVRHKRLTSLNRLPAPIGLGDLEAGDALVVFSKRELLGYRSWLISKGKSVAVIYGDLGPEVRRSEAMRFASGQAEILIATDAIGMGLNLPIKRVIFADTEKYDGYERRGLFNEEWTQIAGRAGRFGLYDKGHYGTLKGAGPLSLLKAGKGVIDFRPPRNLVRELSNWLGLRSLKDLTPFWHNGRNNIQPVHSWAEPSWFEFLAKSKLSVEEQFQYLGAPIDRNNRWAIQDWIGNHEKKRVNNLLVVAEIKPAGNRKDLENLEMISAKARLYAWCHLSFPEFYPDDSSELQARVSNAIAQTLSTKELAKLCNSCGRKLPFDHVHANCDSCYRSRQFYYY